MTTQSLRGLFEAGRLHWRGEQASLDDFNEDGFAGLLARGSGPLDPNEFAEVRAGTFSLVYPANPRASDDRAFSAAAHSGLAELPGVHDVANRGPRRVNHAISRSLTGITAGPGDAAPFAAAAAGEPSRRRRLVLDDSFVDLPVSTCVPTAAVSPAQKAARFTAAARNLRSRDAESFPCV